MVKCSRCGCNHCEIIHAPDLRHLDQMNKSGKGNIHFQTELVSRRHEKAFVMITQELPMNPINVL